jgi:hypothetical protein
MADAARASAGPILRAWANAKQAVFGLSFRLLLDMAGSSPDTLSPARSDVGYIGPSIDMAFEGLSGILSSSAYPQPTRPRQVRPTMMMVVAILMGLLPIMGSTGREPT